jgi:hypothetical protein
VTVRPLEEVGRDSTALEEVGHDSTALEEVGRDSTSRNDSLIIRNSVEHARDAILCCLKFEDGRHVPAPGTVKFVNYSHIRIFYLKTVLFIN